jgi:hypothetical protein
MTIPLTAFSELGSQKIGTHFPAAATAAVVTIAASTEPGVKRHILRWVVVSYSETPTGGRLTVVHGSRTTLDVNITSADPIPLRDLMIFNDLANANEAMVVTLASGGGTAVGKLTIGYQTN